MYAKVALLGAVLLTAVLPAASQTFTDRLAKDGAGAGSVIIYQTTQLKTLLNGRPDVPKPAAPPATPKPQPITPAKPRTGQGSASSKGGTATGGELTDMNERNGRHLGGRGVVRPGYRVQIFSGNNSREARQKAVSTGYLFKSSYLNVPVYTHFYSPHWTCRVGNFRTYEEARAFLSELKATGSFPEATIIKTKIITSADE